MMRKEKLVGQTNKEVEIKLQTTVDLESLRDRSMSSGGAQGTEISTVNPLTHSQEHGSREASDTTEISMTVEYPMDTYAMAVLNGGRYVLFAWLTLTGQLLLLLVLGLDVITSFTYPSRTIWLSAFAVVTVPVLTALRDMADTVSVLVADGDAFPQHNPLFPLDCPIWIPLSIASDFVLTDDSWSFVRFLFGGPILLAFCIVCVVVQVLWALAWVLVNGWTCTGKLWHGILRIVFAVLVGVLSSVVMLNSSSVQDVFLNALALEFLLNVDNLVADRIGHKEVLPTDERAHIRLTKASLQLRVCAEIACTFANWVVFSITLAPLNGLNGGELFGLCFMGVPVSLAIVVLSYWSLM